MDDKIIEALGLAICSYDWRMKDEDFVPDLPCEHLCDFCRDQAEHMVKIVREHHV